MNSLVPPEPPDKVFLTVLLLLIRGAHTAPRAGSSACPEHRRTRGNGLKLKEGRFGQDARGKFSAGSVSRCPGCPQRRWMPRSWAISGPGCVGRWEAPWPSGWQPCLRPAGWNLILQVPSNPSRSTSLRFTTTPRAHAASRRRGGGDRQQHVTAARCPLGFEVAAGGEGARVRPWGGCSSAGLARGYVGVRARAATVSPEGSARGAGGRGGRGRWPPVSGPGASPSAACSGRLSRLWRSWERGWRSLVGYEVAGGREQRCACVSVCAYRDTNVGVCVNVCTRVCVQMCVCARVRASKPSGSSPVCARRVCCGPGGCRCVSALFLGLVLRAPPGRTALSLSWGS